jgi:hypothetical protein
MHKIVYVNFREKKKVEGGFSVNKNKDANLIYREYYKSLSELLESKDYELPPGHECLSDADIAVLITYRGDFSSTAYNRKIAKDNDHTETCKRCGALRFKTVLEKKGLLK